MDINDFNPYLSRVIHSMPGIFYVKNMEGVYLLCNDFSIPGIGDAKAVIGKTDHDLYRKQDADVIRENDLRVMQTAQPLCAEEQVTLADNPPVAFTLNKLPIKSAEGKVVGLVGMSFGVLELLDTQQALKKAKEENIAKTECIENLSHDMIAPLAGILGVSTDLYTKTKNPLVKKAAGLINDASKRLLHTLNETLELARDLSSDAASPVNEFMFDLKRLCQYVITMNAAAANYKKLKVQLTFDEAIPPLLIGDPIRIKAIVGNLFSNAIKFTSKGHIVLAVKLVNQHKNKVTLSFRIEDTGVGIPSDKLSNIYERFTRVTLQEEGKDYGIGLGLSIVKRFLSDIDGEIDVKSSEGKGSVFTCVLPLQVATLQTDIPTYQVEGGEMFDELKEPNLIGYADITRKESSAGGVDQEQEVDLYSGNSKKLADNQRLYVLLVEDDELALLSEKTMLEDLNCVVDIAQDAETALFKAKKTQYNLILLDIGLPDKDGYEVAKEIQRLASNCNRSQGPIVLLTARINSEIDPECEKLGISASVLKPLTPKKASDMISQVFERAVTAGGVSMSATAPEAEHASEPPAADTAEQKLPVLDLALGADLFGGDLAGAKNMLELLANSLPEAQMQLEEAYEAKQWETLNAITHKLHGATCYCGTPQLKDAALRLERALEKAGENERSEPDELYHTLMTAIKLFQETYEIEIANPKPA